VSFGATTIDSTPNRRQVRATRVAASPRRKISTFSNTSAA